MFEKSTKVRVFKQRDMSRRQKTTQEIPTHYINMGSSKRIFSLIAKRIYQI